tara:strand:+ start:684 stop:1991 length:1308 start_codon:yes stop_codon:yes gene_type:complete
MLMTYTKLFRKNGFWVLLERDADGKYILVYKNKTKSLVNKKRVEIQANSIDAQAELHKKTFVNIYEEFANQLLADAIDETTALKVNSVNCYTRWFKYWIKPYFNHRILIQDVCIDNVETWFKEIRNAGCTFKVACDAAQSIKTCLKYAVKKQYIKYVGSLVEWSPKQNKALLPSNRSEYTPKKTPMINRQEVSRLLDHLTPRNNEDIKSIQKYVCISTLAFLGLRMSELIALKWSNISLDAGRWEVTYTIVNGHYARSVKADGSERNNLLPNELWKMLKAWKIVHNKFFGKKCEWLFPSFGYHDVAITEKAVRDWLVLAYQDLGLAEVEIRRSKSGDNKAYLKIKSCKFKGGPSKTFRHFAATALLNHQQADPVVLNDNFIKGYIGHKDIKITRGIYGDHNNLDQTSEQLNKERAAIDNALQINTSNNWSKFTEN